MTGLKAFASLILLPSCLLSQAWLSPQGQGTFSFFYQYGFDRYHFYSKGEALDKGHIFSHALLMDVDYSLSDRLAVRLTLPYIDDKYEGASPHVLVRGQPATAVEVDNGSYHGGIQDFRFDVRYNLSKRKLMLTPFFQAIIPSHGYPTLGHAAIGTDQREYRMGVNVGRRLDPWLPKAYVQGQYAFGFVQEVANVAPKRSYGELQLGYLFSRHLSVQGSTVWTHSYNGIEWINGVYPNNLTDEQWLNHDRISRAELLDVGGSATYSVNRSTGMFLGWGRSLFGANTHQRAAVVTIGFTKSFSTRSGEKSSANALLPASKQALVCTCAKTK